jgi:hypothetical protein
MRVWPHHAQGAWHLYGYSHGNLPDAAAIERREENILPARFDDTDIEGLRKTIGYVDLRQETADSFVELILQKLGSA